MKETLQQFATEDFTTALNHFFDELDIPLHGILKQPGPLDGFLNPDKVTMPDGLSAKVNNVYLQGMVDEKAFRGQERDTDPDDLKREEKTDYDGILLFGIELKRSRPTRTTMADITRLLNRSYNYTPVIAIFRYADCIAFASCERLKYKQKWREGEKAGKVSLLRDININNPHAGHLRILNKLSIPTSGRKTVTSYKKLNKYWRQEVLDVSILNKSFYEELSNWYFWAIRNVTFPGEPKQKANEKDKKFQERLKTHRAQNVIRLITRLIFAWFIKEKGLVPGVLFDKDQLSEIVEFGDQEDSNYYKAILQNLFFATFNQEMGKREFRNDGQNYNVTTLYRYRRFFKAPDKGLELFKDIPFLNGGLFECLDKRDSDGNVKRIDGFSDREDNELEVPNFLFFGNYREVDLSDDYGKKTKKYKNASVEGLFSILNKYVFTIAENTPLEEDVALDPELLGKVFENLLASYNPETKKTARKQTGSFYTPREIVNYMVDESMIAYLKNELTKAEGGYYSLDNDQGDMFGNSARKGQLKMEQKVSSNPWEEKEDELENKLRVLFSYEDEQPFEDESHIKAIINALDNSKILDPACGSGAFPMGVLQKMVHILNKIDPKNKEWKERQIAKIETIDDSQLREESIENTEEAFENNELDFGRKIFLIENCLYGIDIQPIAVQIAKLRFFISLIVDQRLDKNKDNLGIRPLPNLETKFVAANTLIGIDKPKQLRLRNPKIEKLEKQLEEVRHRHFSAKTPKTKRKWRDKDKEIREEIAELLKNDGWGDETARKLSDWDPYDQISSSSFFDAEWMFGIGEGFDIVIGNPPYVFTRNVDFKVDFKKYVKENYLSDIKKTKKSKASQTGKINLFAIFFLKALKLTKREGTVSYILPNNILRTTTYSIIRKYILLRSRVKQIVDLGSGVFENVTASTILFHLQSGKEANDISIVTNIENLHNREFKEKLIPQTQFLKNVSHAFNIYMDKRALKVSQKIKNNHLELGSLCKDIVEGIVAHKYLIQEEADDGYVPLVEGKDIGRFQIEEPSNFLKWNPDEIHRTRSDYIWETNPKIIIQRISGGRKPLVCAIDRNKSKAFASTNNLILKNKYHDHYEYICALINSDLLNWFYANNFSNNSELTVNISKTFLEILPIPFIGVENLFKPLVQIIELLESDTQIYNLFLDVINAMVMEVYFQEHMRANDIDILKFVERDLNNSPQEIMEMRETLYRKWTDPNHEIQSRKHSFTEESPNVLGIILQN